MKNITWDIVPRKEIRTSSLQIPLVLRVRTNGKYFKHSLGISTPNLKSWDAKHKQIRKSAVFDPSEANRQLAAIVKKVSKIISNARINETHLTRDQFASLYYGSALNAGDSFYEFCDEEIKAMKKTGFASETIRSYSSYVSKLKKYRIQLFFSDVTRDFIRDLDVYMVGIGNQQNTRQKMFAFLNTMLNRAKEQGIIMQNILDHKMPVKKREGQRAFLTLDELKQLEGLTPASTSLQVVLRYFLFACYTGLRFTDLKNLRYRDIVMIENTPHVRIIMHKTKDEVTIPLNLRAQALIQNHGLPNEKIFRVRSNQVSNRELKILIGQAGISKTISMHCARHTFGTVCLSFNMGIKVISNMMGHKDLRTTQQYAKLLDKVKIAEMRKWEHL